MGMDHRYISYPNQDTKCGVAGRDTSRILLCMSWQERAQARMKELGLTQQDLMAALGVSTRGAVGHYMTGRRDLNAEQLVSLAAKLRMSLDELMGTGHPVEIREPDNVAYGPNIRGSVPLISWITAGDFQPTSDPFQPGDAEDWFPCPVSHSKFTYALRVRGDSMSPEYSDGEIIFVDPMLEPKHGDDVIVKLIDKEETTFKQLRMEGKRTYLKPLNPDWPEQIIEVNEKAFFKGVVIFSGKKRRK